MTEPFTKDQGPSGPSRSHRPVTNPITDLCDSLLVMNVVLLVDAWISINLQVLGCEESERYDMELEVYQYVMMVAIGLVEVPFGVKKLMNEVFKLKIRLTMHDGSVPCAVGPYKRKDMPSIAHHRKFVSYPTHELHPNYSDRCRRSPSEICDSAQIFKSRGRSDIRCHTQGTVA